MKGVLSIMDVVIALGQRDIPLRGNWDPSKRNEDGNFSSFVDWKSKYHPELKDYLDHASGNANVHFSEDSEPNIKFVRQFH